MTGVVASCMKGGAARDRRQQAGTGHPMPTGGAVGRGDRTHPTVSIILPTYNRRAFLQPAIASVVAQTFGDWELIVVDDGSTDGTRAWLEGIDDARVRPLFIEHQGQTTLVRVAGLRAARAGLIAFLDSDDLWLPDKLALQLQSLKAHPECGWCYGGFQMVDADARPVPLRWGVPYRPHSGWILEPLLQYHATAAIQTLLVRWSVLEEIGGFDESLDLRADYDLAVRLAAQAKAWALPQVVALIREHAGRTTTARRDAELFAEGDAIFRKVVATSPNRRARSLGRQQCARNLVGMAHALSNEGEHRAAIVAVGRALRDAPLAPHVWRAAARCAARSLGWRSRR